MVDRTLPVLPSVQERGQAAVHTTLDLLSRYPVHEMNNLVKSDG